MIRLGLILLILGIVLSVPLPNTIGGILLVVGIVLYALGALGRGLGPRAHHW